MAGGGGGEVDVDVDRPVHTFCSRGTMALVSIGDYRGSQLYIDQPFIIGGNPLIQVIV